jgi:general secretion pathway protein E
MEIAWKADGGADDGAPVAELRTRIEQLAAGSQDSVPALIDAIVDGAAKLGASDVHLESRASEVEVRYRIDGHLVSIASLPGARAANVFARLKLLSRVVTYKKRGPQDGRVAESGGGAVRAAFMPTLHGEKAVLRLANTSAPRELAELGFLPADLDRLKRALTTSQGVIFFTGPCSSGKSTSIYAVLRHLLGTSHLTPNIASLEDPIEQEIDGVNQTQIDPTGGLTFLSGLRTLLRMDPNVLVVGEIRDEETANTVVQAGLSGHLVITTIHGGSAAQVIARLLHMQIEPFLIASAVSAVVAQRLVRRLCDACKQPRPITPAEDRLFLGDSASALECVWGPRGCEACNGIGYSGRTAVLELAVQDDELREAILRSATTSELHAVATSGGMTPLARAAGAKLAAGETSVEELLRVLS